MMEKDRMRFPRIGTPKQDDIGLFNFAIGTRSAARSKNRRQTGDAWRVSSSVATVNVVATNHGTHKFLGGIIQFVGRFGATEHSKRAGATRSDFTLKSSGGETQRFVPRCHAMFSIFLDERSCKPIARSALHASPPAAEAHPWEACAVRQALFSTERIVRAVTNEQV